MRIICCTSNISGYMASCWHALNARPDADLRVIAFEPDNPNAPFNHTILEGLDFTLIDRHGPENTTLVRSLFDEFKPDAALIAGYSFDYYRTLAVSRYLDTRYYACFDTPLKNTWKQRALKHRHRKFFNCLSGAFVASERSYQLVRMLGVPEPTIRRGYYGFDEPIFAKAAEARDQHNWPRAFVTMTRAIPRKGIDLMIDAYARYRHDVSDPWSLIYCGTGELAHKLEQTPGIDYRGFVQPDDLPAVLAESGAFFLTSLYEPWGVVIAEAAGAGLPLACTEACGAGIDVLSDRYNGVKLQTGSASSIYDAMMYFHEHEHELPEMGRRSRELASAYSAEVWAERVVQLCKVSA